MQTTEQAAPLNGPEPAPEGRLALVCDGDRLVLQTGPRAVRQIRRRVQTAGIVAALGA